MSCDEIKKDQCVCEIVRRIAENQRRFEREDVGCEAAINELRARTNRFNTIPLLFVCKDCDYYIASGVFRAPNTTTFNCIQTPVFRVSQVFKDTCCAELELLQPQTAQGTVPPLVDENGVCRFFPINMITRFIRTGICITFNLNCFCGVQCLPAVNAQRGIPQFPPDVCTNPMITLNVDPTIVCAGEVSGTVTCDGEPVENAVVTLSSEGEAVVNFENNPVLTDDEGNFSTIVTIPSGTDPTAVTIIAQTTVNGIPAMDTAPTLVSCPDAPGGPCDGCGIFVVDGPTTTTVTVVSDGVPTDLTGQINLLLNECNNCSTSDNFNFNFSNNDVTINFTQGRRTTIQCTPNTEAIINGVIRVQGNNPYFDNGQVFDVTITVTAPDNIMINATDGNDAFIANYTGDNVTNFEIIDCSP